MSFKEINPAEIDRNPVTLIGKDWWLITAGSEETGYNTMTASWGHLGVIWNKPTAVVYIRPQRYTKQFADREELFTLTVFDESWRRQLSYLGTVSGRDENKIEKAGLTPMFIDGATAFEEAKLILVCRKLYQAPLTSEGFSDSAIPEKHYPAGDFHDMYVGEILRVLVKE